MNEVNKTMYIPLYGKALISRKGIILQDTKAEEIWDKEKFKLKGKSKSKWLAYFLTMRARVFDDWVRMRANYDKDAIVLHIGAGMDSRRLRLSDITNEWYDIDFPDVIDERRKYYEESETYHMLPANVTDVSFLDAFDDGRNVIIIMEGISMYLKIEEISALTTKIEERFRSVNIMMDVYTKFGAKMSRIKNPVKDVGVSQVYGMDNPVLAVNNTAIKFIAEHSMTPQNLIDEMRGMDKAIFKMLFSGRLAKKTYKIYEYALER